jgi:hypothetical protein
MFIFLCSEFISLRGEVTIMFSNLFQNELFTAAAKGTTSKFQLRKSDNRNYHPSVNGRPNVVGRQIVNGFRQSFFQVFLALS